VCVWDENAGFQHDDLGGIPNWEKSAQLIAEKGVCARVGHLPRNHHHRNFTQFGQDCNLTSNMPTIECPGCFQLLERRIYHKHWAHKHKNIRVLPPHIPNPEEIDPIPCPPVENGRGTNDGDQEMDIDVPGPDAPEARDLSSHQVYPNAGTLNCFYLT
jgi:hypothetical protein